MFKSRIFLGTIAAAGILAGATAAPALASARPHHVVKPAGVASGSTVGGLAGTLTGAAPVTGVLSALSGVPILGPLLAGLTSAAPGGATSQTDPVSSAVHGVTSTVSGLSSGAGAVSGTVSSVTGTLKSVPLLGQLVGALPAAGSVTGALSSITSAIPDASAITGLLPASNG